MSDNVFQWLKLRARVWDVLWTIKGSSLSWGS